MPDSRLLPSSAAEAAAQAAVVTRELETLDELGLVNGLFAAIWGSTGAQVAMPVNLLQAIRHAGGYVAGSWRGADLVAAGVGFIGRHGDELELHSHVAGVARSEQGRGVGLALKLHQREWAATRGIGVIAWTFDPLNRGNGWFNLGRLGATAVRYYPDFYGPMVDDLNGTDETDRCLARWETTGPLRPGRPPDPPAVALLEAAPDGGPVVHPAPAGWTGPVTCQVPADAVALRRVDPARAREWRLALRATMRPAMAAGRMATAMTADGRYVLEHPAGEPRR